MEFTEHLIDRTKRYFSARLGLEISDETADEYLGQFAELYSSMAVFAACGERGVAPDTDARLSDEGAGAPAPDLISPHS
ncbi:MAG: hypothetical protein ABIT47_00725 [Candidatus Paceibacterota bacterium]